MKILTLSILSLTAVCVTAGAQNASAPAGSTVQADKQFLQQLEHTDPVGQSPVQGADAPAAPPTKNETPSKPAPVAEKTVPARRTNDSAPLKTADRPATTSVAQERPQTEIRPEKKSRRNVNGRATASTTERVDPAEETAETRPVEKRSRKDVNPKVTTATTEQVTPTAPNNQETVDPQPRRVIRERTSRNIAPDPFYDNGGPAPVRTETRSSRTYAGAQPAPAEVATGPQKTVTVTKTITTLPAPQPPPREHDDENGFFHRLFHPKDRAGD